MYGITIHEYMLLDDTIHYSVVKHKYLWEGWHTQDSFSQLSGFFFKKNANAMAIANVQCMTISERNGIYIHMFEHIFTTNVNAMVMYIIYFLE